MRHRIAGNRLSRNSSLRKATLRDMAKATLIHEQIRTTKAKAKEARKLIDRLITLGKKNTLAAKRRAFAILCDHKLVSNLFSNIATRFQNRPGGYTRIIPFGRNRRGDNASLVVLELTERRSLEVPAKKEGAAAQEKPVRALKVSTKKTKDDRAAVAAESSEETVSEKPEAARQSKKIGAAAKKTASKMEGIQKIFKRKKKEDES